MRELLLLLLLATTQVKADDLALSHIALCHKDWPCERSINPFRNRSEIRLGWLGGPTFGSSCPCSKEILQVNKPKVIRVHIANGPCIRNRRCGAYEIFGGDTSYSIDRAIQRRDRKLLRGFDRYVIRLRHQILSAKNKVTCYVSPVLESDFSSKARGILLRRVKAILPQCEAVDSVTWRSCIKGYICEKHGVDPGLREPCIADLDGDDVDRAGVRVFKQENRHCLLTFTWRPEFNCIRSSEFIDPRVRRCDIF